MAEPRPTTSIDLRIFTEPQQGATYDDLLAVARKAEECGFSAFFRSDHFLSMGSGDGLPGPTDSYLTLAGLARETSTIRLGTLVTSATFREPGLLAIQVAQVDQMSGGRVELGLGAGWFEREHQAYGFGFVPTGERFDRLEEQLAVVTGLLGDAGRGRPSRSSGEHYRLTDSPALPKPVQSARPGDRGRTRQEAHARRSRPATPPSSTSGSATSATVDAQFGRVRAACEDVGRDPHGAGLVGGAAGVRRPRRRRGGAPGRRDRARRRPDRADGLGGTVDQVVETIGRYAEVGVERVYLQVLDLHDLDHLELVAAEVAPQLR